MDAVKERGAVTTGPPAAGFHRRPLKAPGVAYSSFEGQNLFADALAEGNMKTFFALSGENTLGASCWHLISRRPASAENFRTQDEPAYCGLGTLTMALNALAIE